MRASLQVAYGRVEDSLAIREVPTPVPAAGEVLVGVVGATLNRKDLFALQNLSGPGIRSRPPLPHINGTDAWGTVAAIGAGVTGWSIGDRVAVYPGLYCGACEWCARGETSACQWYGVIGEQVPGSHAEYLVAPARNLERVPPHVAWDDLVATSGSWLTAWRALVVVAHVRPGETVVIVGASGGVGTAAICIGRLVGCTVIAVAGSGDKCRRARGAGADAAIDYGAAAFQPAVMEATSGRGADVVLDSVGAATWRQSINSLSAFGRLVICGATSGDGPDFSIREVYQRHRRILGAPLGSRGDFRDLVRVVADGRLKPIVHARFALADIHEALRTLESRRTFGKIAIAP